MPLPQKISEVAVNHLPRFLQEVQRLPQQVAGLGLPDERLARLQSSITNALLGDGSDSAMIFGTEESELYDDLCWARAVKKALDHGAAEALRDLSHLLGEARRLASQGILPDLPDALEAEGSDTLQRVKDGTFHEDLPALTHTLERLQTLVTQCSEEQIKKLTDTLDRQVSSLTASSDFQKLDSGRRTQLKQRLDELSFQPEPTLQGVAKAQTSFASTSADLQSIREEVEKAAHPQAIEPAAEKPHVTSVTLPTSLASEADLDSAIDSLQDTRPAIQSGKSISLNTEN